MEDKFVFSTITYYSSRKSKSGMIFQDNTITKKKLIKWVKRNCKGCICIRISYGYPFQVTAFFKDRIEMYYIKSNNIESIK